MKKKKTTKNPNTFSLKMCIFHKSWWLNFAVVVPHRWAGLLSMCRSFLSVLKKVREGGMKRNLVPLPLALIFLYFLAINYVYLYLLQIQRWWCAAPNMRAWWTGRSLPMFSQSAIFCKGLSNVQTKGRKKNNSIIQNLYYRRLACIHVGRCIFALVWGTSQPSPCTLDGNMGCSSQCSLVGRLQSTQTPH